MKRLNRILVADDDSSVLQLLAAALSDYDLTCARDGAEALEAASHMPPPDLLITDYMMPDVLGDELIARCRERWPDLKVLVLTGHYDLLERESQAWWRREAHLPKPFHVRDLRETVWALLGGHPLPLEAASSFVNAFDDWSTV